jgi:hypothetical protein
VLNVAEKKNECAFKEKYPGASKFNIVKYFSLLWGKPTSQHYIGDILRKKVEE